MRRIFAPIRWVLVTVGVIALTSVTIDATSSLPVSQSALGIIARDVTQTQCPDGMQEVALADRRYCIDTYEASPSDSCPHQKIRSAVDTNTNLAADRCVPTSAAGVVPWTHVSQHQARELCARAGKRLAAPDEWHEAALGVHDANCNIHGGTLKKTGTLQGCVSASGAYDLVGNAWEWVNLTAASGTVTDRLLPKAGYVHGADGAGLATETSATPSPAFGNDYFWGRTNGISALMRGGFFGSGSDAGLFAAHARMDPSFRGEAVGFRCVLRL